MPKPKKIFKGKEAREKYGHPKSPLSRHAIFRRRDIVRTLKFQGFSCSQITDYLSEKTDLLDHCKSPPEVVADDIGFIRKVAKEEVEKGDLDWYNAEYIGQQLEIFRQARKHGDWKAAMESSKNVARARGIDVDEVYRVKGAFLNVRLLTPYGNHFSFCCQ